MGSEAVTWVGEGDDSFSVISRWQAADREGKGADRGSPEGAGERGGISQAPAGAGRGSPGNTPTWPGWCWATFQPPVCAQ